jgi:hypothetical protein
VRPCIEELNDARLATNSNRDEVIERRFGHAVTVLNSSADIFADFIICRTGEVYVSNPLFLDADLEYASVDYANNLKQDFPKWVLDQCYFFLRDIAHRHQHHAPSSDTILILQRRDSEGVRWRRNIIFSLHHYIIRAKRFADTRSLYQSSGVLAYCKSFRAICDRHLGERSSQIPPFNDDALQQSLNARIGEESQTIARWGIDATLRVSRRAFGIAIMAVLVAVVIMLVQPQIEKGEIQELTKASQVVGRHFPGIFSTLIILTIMMWIFTSNILTTTTLGRDVLEAANVRRRRAAVLFSLLGVIILFLTPFFARPAYEDMFATLIEIWQAFTGPP